MRYLVLTAMSIAIVVGFVVFREVLGEADKKFRSSVGFAAILLAGPLYLIFDAFGFGVATAKLHGGEIPSAFRDLNEVINTILFLAGALTYLAAAAFAASLGQAGWIRRGAARVFTIVSLVALLLLVIRGLHFPIRKLSPRPGKSVRDLLSGSRRSHSLFRSYLASFCSGARVKEQPCRKRPN